jgi:hypothetical protein
MSILIGLALLLILSCAVEVWIFLEHILSSNGLWETSFTNAFLIWTLFLALPYLLSVSLAVYSYRIGHRSSELVLLNLTNLGFQAVGAAICVFGISDFSHTGFVILSLGLIIQYTTIAVAWRKYFVTITKIVISMIICFFACVILTDGGMSAWLCIPIIGFLAALPVIKWRKIAKS